MNKSLLEKFEYYFPFVYHEKSILIKINIYYRRLGWQEYLSYLSLFQNKFFGFKYDYNLKDLKESAYFIVDFGRFDSFIIKTVQERKDLIYLELEEIFSKEELI